jgi:hypothetical protein
MASKDRFVKIPSRHFHKMIQKLKSVKSGVKINGKSLHDFLMAESDFNVSPSAIPSEVKVAILKTKGLQDQDHSGLPDEKAMDDFEFTDMNFIRLTKRFNDIARIHQPDAKTIPVAKVMGCDTVKDCVDLVIKTAA